MSLNERLDGDFKAALRAQDAARLSLLRLVRSAIKNFEIAKGAAASDEDIIAVLQREIKQHRETLAALRNLSRADAIAKQEAEVTLLQSYLGEK